MAVKTPCRAAIFQVAIFVGNHNGISDRAKVRKATSLDKLAVLKSIVSSLNLCYNNSYEQKRISATMEYEEQRPYSTIQGENEGNAECSQEGTIRQRRIPQNSTKETDKRVAEKQSYSETLTTSKTVSDRPLGICSDIKQPEESMCDLRDTIKQPQDIPVCRPLPQNGESQGVVMFELQSCDRENEGLTRVIKESCQLSRNQLIIWCGLDIEQRIVEEFCNQSNYSYSSVYGSLPFDEKSKRVDDWIDGKTTILISKPKVLGFGMNFQNAHNMVFLGLNDSWETYYQCIRREWRYGQTQPVNV